jgi:hypothetical protein
MRCDECFRPLSKEKDDIHYTLSYLLFERQMPLIRIFDADNNTGEVINDLFEQVSQEKENSLFQFEEQISFDEIESALVNVLEEEYEDHIKEASLKSQTELQTYIDERYRGIRVSGIIRIF